MSDEAAGWEQISLDDYLAELDTPRNVQPDYSFMNDPHCPNCGYDMAYELRVKRCPGCNQRLAWEWYMQHWYLD